MFPRQFFRNETGDDEIGPASRCAQHRCGTGDYVSQCPNILPISACIGGNICLSLSPGSKAGDSHAITARITKRRDNCPRFGGFRQAASVLARHGFGSKAEGLFRAHSVLRNDQLGQRGLVRQGSYVGRAYSSLTAGYDSVLVYEFHRRVETGLIGAIVER